MVASVLAMNQTKIPVSTSNHIGTYAGANVFREHGKLVVVRRNDDSTLERTVTTCTELNQLPQFFGVEPEESQSETLQTKLF